jgi:vacuolar-type H+-ATPase subunit H
VFLGPGDVAVPSRVQTRSAHWATHGARDRRGDVTGDRSLQCSQAHAVEARLGWCVTDDLDQLLEAERRLAARLDEARTAATQLLELARADAQALAQHAAEQERVGCARIAQETQADLDAELKRIAARAEARLQLYSGLGETRLRELSLSVLQALLEDVPAVQP